MSELYDICCFIYNREKEKNEIVLKKIQFFIKIA